MEWLFNATWAWFGWNVLAPVLMLLIVSAIALLLHIPSMIRQRQCAHERYFENRACDAICCDCRKNLGFIGSLLEKKAQDRREGER